MFRPSLDIRPALNSTGDRQYQKVNICFVGLVIKERIIFNQ